MGSAPHSTYLGKPMKNSIELSALSCRLRETVTAACIAGTLAWKDGFELLTIAHEIAGIENAPEIYGASTEELLLGLALLECELADLAGPWKIQPLSISESEGVASLRLGRIAMHSEFETSSAGLDLVVDRSRDTFLIGDLMESGRPWVEVRVHEHDAAAIAQHVRSVCDMWDK